MFPVKYAVFSIIHCTLFHSAVCSVFWHNVVTYICATEFMSSYYFLVTDSHMYRVWHVIIYVVKGSLIKSIMSIYIVCYCAKGFYSFFFTVCSKFLWCNA